MYSVVKSGPGQLTTTALYCRKKMGPYEQYCDTKLAIRNNKKQIAGEFKCRRCDSIIDVILEYSDHTSVVVADCLVSPRPPSK
jgi:hypothetical protein